MIQTLPYFQSEAADARPDVFELASKTPAGMRHVLARPTTIEEVFRVVTIDQL